MTIRYAALLLFVLSAPPVRAGTPADSVPDFPAALRRAAPVEKIEEAAVYTIHNTIRTPYEMALARKVGSDVLVRAWFKWHDATDYGRLAWEVPEAHQLGALLGGGITCSALYDGENGLSREQVLDMATRGPDGRLVDAWNNPGCRHGTLSNPVYREYLLSWCRRQIDAGADYLFMDEINAALQANEGYDEYSLADFRDFLRDRYVEGRHWLPSDQRWRESLGVDMTDRRVCPDGTLGSFDYRGYLAAHGLVDHSQGDKNPLAGDWRSFRRQRDDRAWKWLSDAIRAYAAAQGRHVLLSGNGLARYVDLQVLGVWKNWLVTDGRIDLAESQLEVWRSTAAAGWSLAGRRVPVVFFHDWGFGGYAWTQVPAEDRRVWIRVRGAEIYAAGAFFAFPVYGSLGYDSLRDGTIGEIARQTAFYQQHRDLYLKARLLGFEPLATAAPRVSLALWSAQDPPVLILHAINRQAESGQPVRQNSVAVQLPVSVTPKAAYAISPDWPGRRPVKTAPGGSGLTVTLPELDAYAVVVLEYDRLPNVAMTGPRIVPAREWARAETSEFVLVPDGFVSDQAALNGLIQGKLHEDLRNPPTFVVNMPKGGTLRVNVQAVATLGANLHYLVDGRPERTIDLPDRDHRNDSNAREYDETYELPIPPGQHRLTLQNVGGDWLSVGWYQFLGEIGQ